MTTSSKKSATPLRQELCIDLPGEAVQCWRSGDNLTVVLRKHRDVIFDLRLGEGKSYTIQSTQSDFYNARDKKLMFAKRNHIVNFKDGERLHLWVTRSFKGALLLKCDNNLIMKIEPNEIDRQQYDIDPKTKPAPIIVALGATSNVAPPLPRKLAAQHAVPPPIAQTAAADVGENCSIVCVVEGSAKDMPAKISRYFANGGGKTGLVEVDPNEVATRNWLLGQIGGAGAYVKDNWGWLRASIDGKTHKGMKLVRAQIHMVRGKVRFYFSGYSKFNTVFGPGGFGPGHERIINIFAGVGKSSSAFKAVATGVAESVKANALISFFFSSATSMAEWKADISKDRYDLAAALIMGLLKTLIAAAITVAIVALFVMGIMAAGTFALSVLAVGIVTMGVGFVVNYAVDASDKSLGRAVTGDKTNSDGLSATLAPLLRAAGKEIEAGWEYLSSKFPKDYQEMPF